MPARGGLAAGAGPLATGWKGADTIVATFTYTNRRGEAYYLQRKARRGGGEGLSFARNMTGAPVECVPEGYEVYEKPENAQVFIRKAKPSAILPSEERAVTTAVRRLAGLEHFIVQREDKSLVVYLADIEPEGRLQLISAIAPMTSADADAMKRYMIGRASYEKMMRFTLTDVERRLFCAERWCFLGSIDNWMHLKLDRPLAELLAAYVPHLGRDSFFAR